MDNSIEKLTFSSQKYPIKTPQSKKPPHFSNIVTRAHAVIHYLSTLFSKLKKDSKKTHWTLLSEDTSSLGRKKISIKKPSTPDARTIEEATLFFLYENRSLLSTFIAEGNYKNPLSDWSKETFTLYTDLFLPFIAFMNHPFSRTSNEEGMQSLKELYERCSPSTIPIPSAQWDDMPRSFPHILAQLENLSEEMHTRLKLFSSRQHPLQSLSQKMAFITRYDKENNVWALPRNKKLLIPEFYFLKNFPCSYFDQKDPFVRDLHHFRVRFFDNISDEERVHVSIQNIEKEIFTKSTSHIVSRAKIRVSSRIFSLSKIISRVTLPFIRNPFRNMHVNFAFYDSEDHTFKAAGNAEGSGDSYKKTITHSFAPHLEQYALHPEQLMKNIPREKRTEVLKEQFRSTFFTNLRKAIADSKRSDRNINIANEDTNFHDMAKLASSFLGFRHHHKQTPKDIKISEKGFLLCSEFVAVHIISATVKTYEELGFEAPPSLTAFGLHSRENVNTISPWRLKKAFMKQGIMTPNNPLMNICDI